MLCRAQIVDLSKHRDELLSRGVQVVIIGPATAEDAAWLLRRVDVPFPVLADATGDVFAAFELREGTARQLSGPKVMVHGVMALARGLFPGGTRGRSKQLPGLALVDRTGRVRVRQAAAHAGDHMSAQALLRVAADVAALDHAQRVTT